MSTASSRSELEKLEAAVAWRRETENAAIANVWHLETVAALTARLRQLIELSEADERLIVLLWQHIPGDDRDDVIAQLRAPGSRYVQGDQRLATIISQSQR